MPRHLWILLAAAALVVSALAAPAAAGKAKRKVRIDSDPPGATVYIGDKKAGAKGTTPVTLDVPVGETTIILELDGFQPHIESVTVSAGKGKAAKSPQKLSFALEKAVGTVRLSGLPEGATVTIDGNEVSAMDDKVDLEPGAHELVVKVPGKDPFDQWVEVASGEEKTVAIKLGGGGDDGGGGGGEGGAGGGEAEVAASSKGHAARPWYGAAGVALEAGWRSFRYSNPQTTNLRPFDANGVGMFDVWGEIAPWRSSGGLHALWPLSIVASFGIGFPVTASTAGGMTADTFWRTTDVGLRWRWQATHELGLDFDGGYARLLYTFRDANNGLVDTIPDVDYQSLRFALRAVMKAGPARVWIGGETRVVLSGGVMQDRFSRGASAQGFGGRLGVAYPLLRGRLELRLEGSLAHYGWTFTTMPGDQYIADGASDLMYGVNFGLGASY